MTVNSVQGPLVTFGEVMLRLTTPGRQRFGQAESLEVTFGGAEANVAVTVAQLGGAAEFVTRLPLNPLGQRALDELRGLGVRVDRVVRGGDRIGVYFLEQGMGQRPGNVVYDRAGSAIATADPSEFNWDQLLAGAGWLHWSGITPALSDQAVDWTRQAVLTARRLGVPVSFDMNYRAKLWSLEKAGEVLRPLVEGVDLCFCGPEEARSILCARSEGEQPIARELMERYGFKKVAMSRRRAEHADACQWGGALFEGDRFWETPWHEVKIVDRVGAGDSFTGGLIFALQKGEDPAFAINLAVAVSALKHTVPGDYALVSLEEAVALVNGAGGGRVRR